VYKNLTNLHIHLHVTCTIYTHSRFIAARCYESAAYVVMRCLSVRLSVRVSVTFVDHVKTNKHIIKTFSPSGSRIILVFFHGKRHSNIPTGTPLTGASNAGGEGRNCVSELLSGLTACVNAETGRCCKRGRLASYDTSLVVSDGVDCRRRRRNSYEKKPQRYAKDNRTAHLTARK